MKSGFELNFYDLLGFKGGTTHLITAPTASLLNKKEESFNYWYAKESVRTWSDEMKDHETYPISKAQFYKYKSRKDAETLEQLTNPKKII